MCVIFKQAEFSFLSFSKQVLSGDHPENSQ